MARQKELTHLEWVKLAASTDRDWRPALLGVHVNDRWVEATDGYRIHRAPSRGMAPGLWDSKSGEAIEARYPNLDNYSARFQPTHEIADIGELRAVSAAALAYRKSLGMGGYVSLRAADGSDVVLQPDWLADVLRGVPSDVHALRIMAKCADKPMQVDLGAGRLAVLMTTRAPANARFDVSDLTRHPQCEAA